MLRVLTGYHKGGVETVQISEKSGVCVSGVRVCMCACVCVCVSVCPFTAGCTRKDRKHGCSGMARV